MCHPHELFEGSDPIDALDAPILAEIPFSPEMQATPRPTEDGVTEYGRQLGAAVRNRLDEVFTVDVPEGAVDLRDVSPEDRKPAVRDGLERTGSGERLYVVSDRDPTPVREYLREMIGEEETLASFQVKRQNPETWLARAKRA